MNPCIDLAKPRTITINAGGHRYDYIISPISASQWESYFAAIVSSSEQKGKEVIEEFDTSRARLLLIDSTLESVSGYKTADGSTVESMQDWKNKLPVKHRLSVAEQLVRVSARDPEDEVVTLGCETVLLSAVWSANENGVLQEFRNLKHTFNTPSAEHFRRFQRDMSRSYIVGGSRGGKTIWKGAQKTLAAIYDELIVSVEGYVHDGDALESREEIAVYMDVYHKVCAMGHLFRPVEVAESDEAQEN